MSGKPRLVLLSFLMLFVELALIRWTGSNVVYLSYFSNFVLLGSFLGIGVGFIRAKRRTDLFPWASTALAFFVAFVFLFPVTIDRTGSQLIYFGGTESGPPIWVVLPIVFLAVAGVMAMIGEGVARTFARFEPLEAYRLDILGSLAGIAAFSLLSFLGAPPLAWGAVVGGAFLLLYRPGLKLLQVAGIVLMVAMLAKESFTSGYSWSPYYKILEFQVPPGFVAVNVNGIPHQVIQSVAQADPIYSLPYQRAKGNPLRNVLIVGAGTGNDTAIALSMGAKHVDAVEIDPRILEIGRETHPNHPYQDPRVTLHNDDGRAFLERSHDRYDLILFALPDSLTLVSGQSSLRLESYLFTEESMKQARAHLRPGGAFGMYNYYRQPWLIDRLASTLQQAYGRPPCVDSVGRFGNLALLMAGSEAGAVTCPTPWQPHVVESADAIQQPATDDHPFLYLKTPSIPGFYILTLLLILASAILLVRGASGPLTQMRTYVDLFFMGAAFLLLETKSIVQFALLFGTTWFVNALVFTGILLAVLGAIEVTRRTSLRRPDVLYGLLVAALAVAWLIPPDRLLALSLGVRFVTATLVTFTPIFLANLIFASRFRDVESSTVAFGANLLGAMIGGLLEYLSLATGYRALIPLIAVLYGLAYLFGRRHLSQPVDGEAHAVDGGVGALVRGRSESST